MFSPGHVEVAQQQWCGLLRQLRCIPCRVWLCVWPPMKNPNDMYFIMFVLFIQLKNNVRIIMCRVCFWRACLGMTGHFLGNSDVGATWATRCTLVKHGCSALLKVIKRIYGYPTTHWSLCQGTRGSRWPQESSWVKRETGPSNTRTEAELPGTGVVSILWICGFAHWGSECTHTRLIHSIPLQKRQDV